MCGINAVISQEDSCNDLYEGLYHLQHRGQDSFGISYFNDKDEIKTIKSTGLLSDNNTDNQKINIGIGHVRYPTTGKITLNECQPLILNDNKYSISIVHNGQINLNDKLKQFLIEKEIKIPKNSSDSHYLLYLLSYYLNQYSSLTIDIIKDIIINTQNLLDGSYNCICIISGYGLICFKDKNSIRPLIYGKRDDNYIISSESISLTSLNYDICDDIYGNDLLYFDLKYKLHKLKLSDKNVFTPCIFEWVYLAREESILYNVNVYSARVKMGEYLSKKIKKNIDINEIDSIIPVPDTSKPIALKISNMLGIPYNEAITKNRYVNRTFIMNNQKNRIFNIKRKLNIIKHLVENKNIMIVDDSIVRGNTLKHMINLLKENDVNKIFVVSSCPEIINKNIYGLDIPDKNQLLCFNYKKEEIEESYKIDKLIFQDIHDLKKSISDLNPDIINFETSIFENN